MQITTRHLSIFFGLLGLLTLGQFIGIFSQTHGLAWTAIYMQIPLATAAVVATGLALKSTRRPALWAGMLSALGTLAASTSWIWLAGPSAINIFGILSGGASGLLALGVALCLRLRPHR